MIVNQVTQPDWFSCLISDPTRSFSISLPQANNNKKLTERFEWLHVPVKTAMAELGVSGCWSALASSASPGPCPELNAMQTSVQSQLISECDSYSISPIPAGAGVFFHVMRPISTGLTQTTTRDEGCHEVLSTNPGGRGGQ